jgi:hypothetical protein
MISGRGSPARSRIVGSTSIIDTGCSTRRPPRIPRGHTKISGTRVL